MKKNFTLLFALLICVNVFAQNKTTVNNSHPTLTPLQQQHIAAARKTIADKQKHYHSGAKSTGGSAWYNVPNTVGAIDIANSGTSNVDYHANYLFPDSTINGTFGTAISSVWIHNLGDVLDPTAPLWTDPAIVQNGDIIVGKTDAYTLDSFGVFMIYTRNPAMTTVVDTLVLDVFKSARTGVGFFTSTLASNLSTDTVFTFDIPYSPTTNATTLTTTQVKIPLNLTFYADSISDQVYYVQVSTAGLGAVAANNLVGATMQFKPGYTWTPLVDTIDNKNYVLFESSEPYGTATFPYYQKPYLGCSYIVPSDVRYNGAGGWNGSFIPSYAYCGTSPNYGFDAHDFFYKINCASCQQYAPTVGGVENVNGQFTIGDVYPNPTTVGNTVSIPVNAKAGSKANVKVYNAIGQMVAEQNAAVNNNIKVETLGFNPGIYVYTIEINGDKKSGKFSLVK